MPGKQTFCDPNWFVKELNPDIAGWLKPVENDAGSVFCIPCKKSIKLSNMGIGAVTGHAAGDKHKRNFAIMMKTPAINSFFGKSSNKAKPVTLSSSEPSQNQSVVMHDPPVAVQHVEPNRVTLKDFGFKNGLFKSEIFWALCSTDAHLSNRQSEKLSPTFKLMFPDSQVAQNFSVGKDKMGYLSTHGLYPFFKEQVEESLHKSQFFSVGYDESLNKVAQKTQMDINIRHLDSSTGLVSTKYHTSEFLGSCKAVDLLEHLNKGLGSAKFDKLVSLSMDGPNVNWAMLRDLKLQRSVKFPDAPDLIVW